MGSEKLGTCDERVRHTWDEVTGEVPHRLSGMCRNWREQPQGEAVSEYRISTNGIEYRLRHLDAIDGFAILVFLASVAGAIFAYFLRHP